MIDQDRIARCPDVFAPMPHAEPFGRKRRRRKPGTAPTAPPAPARHLRSLPRTSQAPPPPRSQPPQRSWAEWSRGLTSLAAIIFAVL